MANLSTYINFTVTLDKSTDNPFISFVDTSAYPAGIAQTINGKVSVTQPDAFTDAGTANDVIWDNVALALTPCNKSLRLDIKKELQNGVYTFKYVVSAPGYDDTVLTKTVSIAYDSPKGNIKDLFDIFTPSLKVSDNTDYSTPGFNIGTINRIWNATVSGISTGEVGLSGSGATFDLKYNNHYYDAYYDISLSSIYSINGIGSNHWVSIKDSLIATYITEAHTPVSINDVIDGLANLKIGIERKEYCGCGDDFPCEMETYNYAVSIYEQFLQRGINKQFTSPDRLDIYLWQLVKIYTGCSNITYPNIGQIILAYDFNEDSGGGNTPTPDYLLYKGQSPTTLSVGGLSANTEIYDKSYDWIIQAMTCPYISPVISLMQVTPGVLQYNQTNVTVNISYKWTKQDNAPDLQSATIQYKRASQDDAQWVDLPTSSLPTLPSTDSNVTLSASIVINPVSPNNDPVQFRVKATDTQENISSVSNLSFADYAAPTATAPVSSSTKDRGNVQGILSSIVTRNSPNVLLMNYQFQYRINNSSWVNIASASGNLSGATQTVSYNFTTSDTNILNANTLDFRVLVTDAIGSIGGNVGTLNLSYQSGIVNKAASTLSFSDLSTMINAQYDNGKVRTIQGVTSGVDNYTYFVYAAMAGDLLSVIQNDSLPVLSAFVKQSDITGTNGYGATLTYRVYKSYDPNPFTNAKLSFS